ncbi:Uncharacterised protein [Escherichia coli]|uniref:Uncharacterized protein n=1 Tax=Escherichia coli TaxID=562 RepID=A0AAX2KM23_ECOLX|nr:Uncharacterised protein [Escherichia coli]
MRALEPTDAALTRKNIDVYSKAEVDLKKRDEIHQSQCSFWS